MISALNAIGCFVFGLLCGSGLVGAVYGWLWSKEAFRRTALQRIHDNHPIEFHSVCRAVVDEDFDDQENGGAE